MSILLLTGRLLKGALIGGLVGLTSGFVILTVVGVIFYGIGGLLMGLYFVYLPIFYAAPVGTLVGAVVGVFRGIRHSETRLNLLSGVWIGALLLGLVALVSLPQLLIGEERIVTHGATWQIEPEPHDDCAIPVVRLYLVEYAHYEEVCSELLSIALVSETRDIIPMSYVVTYDFGDARGYHLSNVDGLAISYAAWLGGSSGCGTAYDFTCDSPQAKDDSMLYRSTWNGA